MLFNKSSILLAAVALSSAVSAAINAFIEPAEGAVLKGKTTIDITWKPDGGKNVQITLRRGDSKNLDDVQVVAANIANSGSFKWEVPDALPSGKDYAFMIVDLDTEEPNYTGLFTIETSNKAAATTKASTTTTGTASKTSTTAASTTTAADDEDDEDSTTAPAKTTTKPTGTPAADDKDDEKDEGPDSSAAALSKSPIALVVCLIGAFFYLN